MKKYRVLKQGTGHDLIEHNDIIELEEIEVKESLENELLESGMNYVDMIKAVTIAKAHYTAHPEELGLKILDSDLLLKYDVDSPEKSMDCAWIRYAGQHYVKLEDVFKVVDSAVDKLYSTRANTVALRDLIRSAIEGMKK